MNFDVIVRPVDSWNLRLMEMAFCISELSKDTSSKVGAVIISPCKTKISCGFNGFPSGIPDYKIWWDNRKNGAELFTKYDLVEHAERNAIDNCREDLKDWSIFVTDRPCFNCTKAIYKTGIKEIFYSNKNEIKMDLQTEKSEFIIKTGFIKTTFIDKKLLFTEQTKDKHV